MKKNLNIMNYSEQMLSVPWPFVKSGSIVHEILVTLKFGEFSDFSKILKIIKVKGIRIKCY